MRPSLDRFVLYWEEASSEYDRWHAYEARERGEWEQQNVLTSQKDDCEHCHDLPKASPECPVFGSCRNRVPADFHDQE